jgi:hypothetical protein
MPDDKEAIQGHALDERPCIEPRRQPETGSLQPLRPAFAKSRQPDRERESQQRRRAKHHESGTRPSNLAHQGADHEAADRSGRDDRAHSAAAPRGTGRLGGRQRLGCDVHRGERQAPQQPGDEQPPHAGQAGVTHCREQRTHRRQQAGSPRSSLGIEAGDPAVTGDSHQAVGGEQQAGFCQRHAILVVIERQE